MKNGGRRAGAGRKKNPKLDDDLREYLVQHNAAKKVMPLAIMTSCARAAYHLAMRDPFKLDMEMLKLAQDWAKDVANYYHPKLVSQEVSGKGGGPIDVMVKSTVQVYLPDNGRRVIDITPERARRAVKAETPPDAPPQEDPDADETLPPEPRKRDDEEQEPGRESVPMWGPEAVSA